MSFAPTEVRSLVGLAGLNLGSLVFMLIFVAARIGSIDPWLAIHLNAEGTPDLWGTRSTLWRLPFMVGMLTLMSGAVSWFMVKRDLFASRFVLLASLLIHAFAWIALIHLLA